MAGAIARRYARALFDAVSPGDLDATQSALDSFSTTWVENSELRVSLMNPAFPEHQRESALTAVVQSQSNGASSQLVANALVTMLRNHRLEFVTQVTEIFRGLVSAFRRSLDLTITTARVLDEAEQQTLKAEIERGCGAPIRVTWKVATELIGGMRIEAGDRLIERSIQGALERAREEFIHAC